VYITQGVVQKTASPDSRLLQGVRADLLGSTGARRARVTR